MHFYLIKILLLFFVISCIKCNIVCPSMQFWDGKECMDCSINCDKCTGPNANDCESCSADTCHIFDKGCEPCVVKNSIITVTKNVKMYDPEELETITTKSIEKNDNDKSADYKSVIIIMLMITLVAIIFILPLTLLFVIYYNRKFHRHDIGHPIIPLYPCNDNIIMDESLPNKKLSSCKESRNLMNFNDENFIIGSKKNSEKYNSNNQIMDKTFDVNFPKNDLYEGSLLLQYKEILGSGTFGTVYKCPYVEGGTYIWVAIKMANRSSKEPTREREALAHLSHLNIVQLKAINMNEHLALVMPLRQNNLKTFLVEEKQSITVSHQIRYCMQIADAMRYMIYKNMIHCDLKASNILVVNINHIEICDFGKSEKLYQKRGKKTVGTITHAALELLDRINNQDIGTSEATEVWSFGVTAWEIFTFEERHPYAVEVNSNHLTEISILNFLSSGKRLYLPQDLSSNLQTIIFACWLKLSLERPTFNQLFYNLSKALPEAQSLPPNEILEKKCYFGICKDYVYPNGTEEDVCLCYTCRPKERFVVQNRFSSYEIVMVDFPYCTILLPSRANELCRGYCNGGEKCGDGGCAINSKNETADRCICQKCPLHDENFLPVFDFMF